MGTKMAAGRLLIGDGCADAVCRGSGEWQRCAAGVAIVATRDIERTLGLPRPRRVNRLPAELEEAVEPAKSAAPRRGLDAQLSACRCCSRLTGRAARWVACASRARRRSTGRAWRSRRVSRRPVFVGDIGDNDARRESVMVYRVLEPALDAKSGDPVTTLEARYPDGARDAEAMFVLPPQRIYIRRRLNRSHRALSLPRRRTAMYRQCSNACAPWVPGRRSSSPTG